MAADVVKCAQPAALLPEDDDVVRADRLELVRTRLAKLGAAADAQPRSGEDAILLHREDVIAHVVALRHRARTLDEAFDRAEKGGQGECEGGSVSEIIPRGRGRASEDENVLASSQSRAPRVPRKGLTCRDACPVLQDTIRRLVSHAERVPALDA